MHRFPADLRLRKVWIQRCKNARLNFVFVNSDQTRKCGVHFVGRGGPTKGDPFPCFFIQAAGGENVYKLTTLENEPQADEKNSTPETEEMSDNRSLDLSFENEADGLLVDSSASLLDISLRLHDYGRFTPVPAIIRHQYEQVQPQMVFVGTQTDDTRVPRSTSTQTSTETSTAGIQVDRPSFDFKDVRDDKSKVLFYTGIPNAETIECLFDEVSVGMKGNNSGRPKSLRLIDEFFYGFDETWARTFA